MKILVFILGLFAALQGVGQITVSDTITTQTGPADTLTPTVVGWEKAKPLATKYGESRDLTTSVTHDLALLDIRAFTLSTGKSFTPSPKEAADHLLIVHDGNLTVAIGGQRKVLGPGGIGLFSAGDTPILLNTGTSNVTCYWLSFRSKGQIDHARAKQGGGPVLLDWTDLQMKKTDKGESRPVFSRPVAWLSKIDMHATTLDPGQISHPQHVHRNEEIILMRSGNVRMHIAGDYRKATAGDVIFLPSGVPHDLENGPDGRCEYFALQWEP
jgi:(S)-ureidoglycine aminohydrolase